jgi:hypothetical protein
MNTQKVQAIIDAMPAGAALRLLSQQYTTPKGDPPEVMLRLLVEAALASGWKPPTRWKE